MPAPLTSSVLKILSSAAERADGRITATVGSSALAFALEEGFARSEPGDPLTHAITLAGRRALLSERHLELLRSVGPNGALAPTAPWQSTHRLARWHLVRFLAADGSYHATDGDTGVAAPPRRPCTTDLGRQVAADPPKGSCPEPEPLLPTTPNRNEASTVTRQTDTRGRGSRPAPMPTGSVTTALSLLPADDTDLSANAVLVLAAVTGRSPSAVLADPQEEFVAVAADLIADLLVHGGRLLQAGGDGTLFHMIAAAAAHVAGRSSVADCDPADHALAGRCAQIVECLLDHAGRYGDEVPLRLLAVALAATADSAGPVHGFLEVIIDRTPEDDGVPIVVDDDTVSCAKDAGFKVFVLDPVREGSDEAWVAEQLEAAEGFSPTAAAVIRDAALRYRNTY